MTQTILVFIIIGLTIAYSAYALVKNLRKKQTSACGDCNGCDIKNEILQHSKKGIIKDPSSCGCAPHNKTV